jgi:DNA-directed RNA polymerase
MRDPEIARLTSVAPDPQPQDLYQHVADGVTDYCKIHTDENPWYPQFLEHWNMGIDRSVTKRSTMCEAYGLTFYGIQKYIRLEGHVDWVPRESRGGAIVELARATQAALNTTLSSSNAGKAYLKSISDIASDLNQHLCWTTPSGFKVVHYYTETQTRRSIAKLFNSRELHFFVKTDTPASRSAKQAISPNYIHSLDAAHVFLVLAALLSEGLTDFCMIHDSYGCHANDVPLMSRITREEFAGMHKTNQLQFFKEDVEKNLGVNLPDVPVQGDFDVSTVLDSQYFFA